MVTVEALDAVAQQYGRRVLDDGTITKNLSGDLTGVKVRINNRKRRCIEIVGSASGTLLFTGGTADSLGVFLERYWYDKKR